MTTQVHAQCMARSLWLALLKVESLASVRDREKDSSLILGKFQTYRRSITFLVARITCWLYLGMILKVLFRMQIHIKRDQRKELVKPMRGART